MRRRFTRALILAAAVSATCTAGPAQATVTSSIASGVLTVSSDAGDAIVVDCPAGVVHVNTVDPSGGPVACAAVTESHVFGGPSANAITLTGVTPALFPALTSSEIQGFGIADTVDGSGIGDTIAGGTGADDLDGGGGSDVFVWNPGDGSDVIDGEGDSDTVTFNGSAAIETFTVNPNGARVEVLRNVGAIDLDIGTTELLVLNGLGGADTMTANDGVGPLIAITMNAGDGGDTLDGGAGTDDVSGNAGNDNLLIRDETPDTANCGDGIDSVTADAQGVDTIAGDCESVSFPGLPELPVTPGDTAAPDTQITASPKAKTKKKQASFSFTSTETGSTFQCKLDDDPFAACTSPFEDKVKKGKHHFEVRAIDPAGNADPTPATYEWKVKKPK